MNCLGFSTVSNPDTSRKPAVGEDSEQERGQGLTEGEQGEGAGGVS